MLRLKNSLYNTYCINSMCQSHFPLILKNIIFSSNDVFELYFSSFLNSNRSFNSVNHTLSSVYFYLSHRYMKSKTLSAADLPDNKAPWVVPGYSLLVASPAKNKRPLTSCFNFFLAVSSIPTLLYE